jgi:hypothetical protein
MSKTFNPASSIFYNYVYLDPRRPGRFTYKNFITFFYKPRYIGKGNGNRLFDHLKYSQCHNKQLGGFIRNIIDVGFNPKEYIFKVIENVNEIDALIHEEYLIKTIGRLDKKTGPLFNHQDKGEPFNQPTYKKCWVYNEQLNKRKQINIILLFEFLNQGWIRGTNLKHTEEWKKNQSKKMKGRPGRIRTAEQRKKMSESLRGVNKGIKKPPRTKEHTSNLKKANNGKVVIINRELNKVKRVDPFLLDEYYEIGWEIGFYYTSDETKKKQAEKAKNRNYKEPYEIRLLNNQKRMIGKNKGKITIFNLGIIKRVNSEQLDTYLASGWRKGTK